MYLITSAVSGILGLIFLTAWVLLSLYSIVYIARNPNANRGLKVLWILIIIVFPIVGAISYLVWKKYRNF